MSATNRTESVPFVSIIIPVTGWSASLESDLITLINQRYQSFEIIFVVQDKKDSADSVINKIVQEEERVRRVYSEPTSTCSQKNHNLLAGIQEAGKAPDILVFCDCGHSAQPDWLDRLLAPLLSQSSCSVTSGYHQILPERYCLPSVGRAICVLTLSLIRRLPSLGQPWGGAMAIRRETFENIAVADIWKENIVDDVSLARLLQKENISVTIPDKTDLETRLDDLTLGSWIVWLSRQWAYLKFIFPGLWLLAGWVTILIAFLVHASLLICLTAPFFSISAKFFQYGLFFSIIFFISSCFLHFKHPRPGPFYLWFPASLTALAMGGWCHMRTWFSNTIDWANIQYHVGGNGRVTKIIRHESDQSL